MNMHHEKEVGDLPDWNVCIVTTGDRASPTGYNAHTHGLVEYGHPDLQIVLPIHPRTARQILDKMARAIRKGLRFEVNEKYENILLDQCVRIIAASENGRDVLRVVLPTKDGQLELADMNAEFALQYHPGASSRWLH